MDDGALKASIEHVSELLKAHGGGLELESCSTDGDVVVRFTGMCTGCKYKPVTMASVVRQEIMTVPGIKSVSSEGSRTSPYAEERLARYLSEQWRRPSPRPREEPAGL